MEHRWGNRLPINVEVQIFADPASAGWGRLRNISVSGGFIETSLQVPPLSTLRMSAPAERLGGARVLHAIAVRRGVNGIGVEWFDGQSEAITALIREATAWQTQRSCTRSDPGQPVSARAHLPT